MIARASSPSRVMWPNIFTTWPGPGSTYAGHGPNLEMQAQPMSNSPSATAAGSLRLGPLVSLCIAIDRLVLARHVEPALEMRRQLHDLRLIDVARLRQARRQVDVERHARRTRAQHDHAR